MALGVRIRNKMAQSIEFNGSTSSIITTVNPTAMANLSIAFWLYFPEIPDADNERVIDCSDAGPINGLTFTFGTAGASNRDKVLFAGYSGAGTTWSLVSNTLQTGEWHHICGTFTTNNAKLYVDGGYLSVDALCTMGASATEVITIGRRSQAATNYSKVSIADVRLYDVVLTDNEILELADGKKQDRGLINNWTGETSGTTVVDVVGNKNATFNAITTNSSNIPGPIRRGSAVRQ